jgi:hypothetical protein
MWPVPTILMVAMAALSLLTVIAFVSTGNIMATLVILLLVGIVGVVLYRLGVINVTTTASGVDFGFYEKAPAPAHSKSISISPKSIEQSEVFYVSGNEYTYDDAPAVCAAYGAELATYDQVNDAYTAGGEWCGYGWTQGGMALFPTQQATWELLQSETDATKRTGCGRPGVNGGYFNPSNKFGVNCYGAKPGNKNIKFPLPVPGTDSSSFNQMVDKYKGMLNRMSVSAFNRMGWSEWNVKAHVPGELQSLESEIYNEFAGSKNKQKHHKK